MAGETATEARQTATIKLWPDAGRDGLGIGKELTFRLAQRGEFPGAVRLGRKWLVLRAPFQRALEEGWQPDEPRPAT